MPHRTLSIVLGVIGLIALVGLVVARVDLARAARSGPAWRRRIVGAGLALLTSLGVYSPAAAEPAAKPPAAAPAKPSARLAATPEWKRIQQTWSEAEAIASGKRGSHPFDAAGKKRALAALDGADKDIEALVRSGALSAPEGGLLKKELQQLRQGVEAMRPTEMRAATCYEPMAITEGRDSMRRLQDRLPLLEKLAASKRIEAAVVQKVLARIESDVQRLDGGSVRDLSASNKQKGQKLAKAARAHIAKIRALAGIK